MSDNNKRLILIVSGFIFVVAIILMMQGRDGSRTIVNQAGAVPNNDLMNFGDVVVQRQPFTLPDFGVVRAADKLQAIGACCADCRPSAGVRNSYAPAMPRTTIVFNEGDKGANVFNYYAPKPQTFKPYGIASAWRR